MAAVRVQATGKFQGNNVTSFNGSFGGAVTPGNFVLVVCWGWEATAMNWSAGDVTDNQGNSYQMAVEGPLGGNSRSAIYYAMNVAASGTFTITINPTAVGAFYGFASAIEWSGLATSSALDQTQTNSGTSTTPSTGSTAVLSEANEMVAAVFTIATTQGSITVDAVSPAYTQELEELDFSVDIPGEGNTRVASGSGAQSCSWTCTTSAAWSACIATFKLFAGGGGGTEWVTTTLAVEYRTTTDTWRDLTADIVASAGLRFFYGIPGNSPLDSTASPGECSFVLRNDAGNSGGLLGYYSPRHANVRAEWTFGAQLRVTIGGTVKFLGRVAVIDPLPGAKMSRYVYVVAQDRIAALVDADVREVSLMVTKREDELLTEILDSLPSSAQPVTRALDIGADTVTYAFHNLGEGTKALGLIQAVVQSSYGLYFQRGDGTHVFKNRHNRAITASATTLTNTMTGLVAASSVERCFNIVRTTIHPKSITSSPLTELLFALPAGTSVELAPGETKDVWCEYTDPNDRATAVGGLDVTVNVVAYGNPAGTGTNLSIASVTTPFASTALVTLANVHAVNIYVTVLNLFGRAMRDLAPQTLEVSSVQNYVRPVNIDLPYQENSTFAAGLADLIHTQFSEITDQIDAVEFVANSTSTLMAQALAREPGDVVTLTETVTGVTATDVVIHNVEFNMTPSDIGPLIRCKWGVAPAYPIAPPWMLGTSQLGSTTVLGL